MTNFLNNLRNVYKPTKEINLNFERYIGYGLCILEREVIILSLTNIKRKVGNIKNGKNAQ